MENTFYYDKLTKVEKEIYQKMKIGIEAYEDCIIVPREDIHRLSEIFFYLRLDHPRIFWVTGFKCRSYRQSDYVQILPEYLFDKGRIKEQKQALEMRIQKLTRPVLDKQPEEKEKYIHDFICENVKYDKLKKSYSHEIIGPLGHGVGVCEGIAKAVKALCDQLGLWCIIVISEANKEKNIQYRHAWNVIKQGNNYYHLDVTFDNTLCREEIRYDYFNLSDAKVFRDHEPVIDRVPKCEENNSFYYMKKKLSFTKIEDLEKRVRQNIKKKRVFIFHWRGSVLTRNEYDKIVQMIQKCAQERHLSVKIHVNPAQAIIQMSPAEKISAEEVQFDDLNSMM